MLRVHVASPLLGACFALLARQVAGMSDGRFSLAPCGRDEEPEARLGALAFGPGAAAPPLELFAGLPCGMAPVELGAWLMSRDGADLWSEAHALRGQCALPCAIFAFSGLLRSAVQVTGAGDLAALSLACRPDGILGLALRDMGANAVAMAPQAALVAGVPSPALGAGSRDMPHVCRLTPPFGATIELATTETAFRTLEHRDRAVLEQACAATFRESLDALRAVDRSQQGVASAPSTLAAAMATGIAVRLQDCLAQPEATRLRSAERYMAARMAGLRYDAWA